MADGSRGPGAWTTLPRSRFAPLGAEGATPLMWVGRASIVLLALGGLYLLFALLRPLPSPGPEAGPLPEPVPAPDLDQSPVERRQSLLASLTDDNPFAPDRLAWSPAERGGPGGGGQRPGDDGDDEAPGEDADVANAPAPDRPAGRSIIEGLTITDAEDLEQDLAAALKNIELRGIVSTTAGPPAAMISFVQSPTRDRSTRFRIGEEFVDDAHPSDPWRVVYVDADRDRVVLSREGRNMVVPLFRTAMAPAPAPEPGADAGDETPEQRRARVVERLRAEGLSAAQIEEILALTDEAIAAADQAEREALAENAEPPKTLEDHEDTIEQAGGLESIMSLMRSASENSRRFTPPGQRQEDDPEEPEQNGGGGG